MEADRKPISHGRAWPDALRDMARYKDVSFWSKAFRFTAIFLLLFVAVEVRRAEEDGRYRREQIRAREHAFREGQE